MHGSGSTRRVARLAARQHGNVHRDELRAAGLIPWEIEHRVATGWLVRRHVGVYAVGHVPRSRESRWHAATLALGPAAALSHRAAGAHFGLLRGTVPTEVTVPPGGGHRHRDGIVVHRSLLAPEEIVVHRGIRVTSLLRTLLDIAAVVGPRVLARAFEEAQVLHGLAPEDVAVAVLTRAGFRGNARLRVVLDGAVDPAAVRSVLELRFLRLCAQGGVRRPLVNVPVGGWVPDFRWEAERVIVETDGVRFHRTAAKRLRDARKDEALRALGYLVIRLTWADVVQRPERTLALVDGALAAGRAAA